MLKLFNTLFIFSVVLTYGECTFGRNSFDGRLRACNVFCLPRELRRTEVQNCLVLLDHNNTTVTRCAAECMERKRVGLGVAKECKCRNHRCILEPEPTSTPSSTKSTAPTPSSSTAASSTPASSTPASSTPASSTPASSTPASSTPASSTPASSTPASSTPASGTPASSTPAPNTPAPNTPAPNTPAPNTPAPNNG